MSRRTFQIYCNHQTYEFPLDTFKQVSKKCAALVKNKDYQGTINHPVSEEAFQAFSAACRLEDFQTTQTNAFELLDLAQEWGIKSLETFVSNYITAKGLVRPEEGDHLQPLLQHLEEENDKYDIKDVIGIAKNFDAYLQDDRLLQLNPETIFQIFHHAELRGIDSKNYTDYVLKQFDNDPEKAVPLTLLMDFDHLTHEQKEDIFQCREMHEEFVGYFIAAALSALASKARQDLDDSEERNLKEIDDLRDTLKKLRNDTLGKLQETFSNETTAITQQIEKQRQEIETLRNKKTELQTKINNENRKFDETEAEFLRAIEKQKDSIEEMRSMIDTRQKTISYQIKHQFGTLRTETSDQIGEIEYNDQNRISETTEVLEKAANEVLQKSDDVSQRSSEVQAKVQSDCKWAKTVSSTFGAKIVRDQLRFDHFLRNVSKRFQVFETDPKIWDIDANDAKQAEETLIKLETKINTACPLSVRQQMDVSVNAFQQLANLFGGKA